MKKASDVSKIVRQARKALGLNGENQQALIRRVRSAHSLTNEALADALGIKVPTLLAYLAPASAAKHRSLPAELRLVLAHMLERAPKRNRK